MTRSILTKLSKLTAALLAALVATVTLATVPASATTTVAVNSAGDLVITGGNGADHVTITSHDGESTQVHVINGTTMVTHDIPAYYRDMVVNLRGGNDTFILGGSGRAPVIPRDLKLTLGSGSNDATFNSGRIGRNLVATDGSGSSDLAFWGIRVTGSTSIFLSGGAHNIESVWNRFDGNYTITTSTTGSIDHHASDDNYGGVYTMTTGNKVDKAIFEYRVKFEDRVNINLKGGNDTLWAIHESKFDQVSDIRMGSGNDFAFLKTNRIHSSLKIRGEAGSDRITLAGNIFYGASTFDGGSNVDYLGGEANFFYVSPTIVGIENVD